jgi:hypothetical protein
MPTNRTPINRKPALRITPEIISAWKRVDFMALHRLLGLKSWQSSPLPYEITALGVSQDDTPDNCSSTWDESMPKAITLQKQLLELAGWPDCCSLYHEKLREAEEWAQYCREHVEHPPLGEFGTGSDPESRRENLADAEDEVAYRRELLAGLDAVQAKWAPGTR